LQIFLGVRFKIFLYMQHFHIWLNFNLIFESQPRKSREHWKLRNLTMLNECNWRFLGLHEWVWKRKIYFVFPPFLPIEYIFLHQSQWQSLVSNLFCFNIDYWNASLVIVIGFGAKICIQLVEKGEIQNKFFFSIPIHVTLESANYIRWALSNFAAFNAHDSF